MTHRKIAVLVDDYFQIHEAYYPYFRLKETGAKVLFVGNRARRTYHDYGGEPLTSDISVEMALHRRFDCIYCPGGFAPMRLRGNPMMLKLSQHHFGSGRLLAAICHGASFLVAADLVKGRKMTGYQSLKEDITNAGAEYLDYAPVVNHNLITARSHEELPQFTEAIVRYLESGPEGAIAPPRQPLSRGTKIAILLEQRYHALQVWCWLYRMRAAGADVVLVGDQSRSEYKSRVSRIPAVSDLNVAEARSQEYAAIIVTGDWAADKVRMHPAFLQLVGDQLARGGLLVSMAEGHSVLVSARILKNRTIAGPPEMKRELENSGARVTADGVVTDGNLISARDTEDLPELMRRVMSYLGAHRIA